MAKASTTYVLDGLLDKVAEANKLTLCSGQPTTFTEANATNMLASIAMDSGDFSKADNGANRRLTIAAQSALTYNAAGSADHVALVDTVNSRLLNVTTCPARSIQSGDTINTASYTADVNQPT